VIHCNTLQHTATYCRVLSSTSCNLSYIEECGDLTHCNILHHTAHAGRHFQKLQHTAAHCNTLQRTATHCSALQHADLSCTEECSELTSSFLCWCVDTMYGRRGYSTFLAQRMPFTTRRSVTQPHPLPPLSAAAHTL